MNYCNPNYVTMLVSIILGLGIAILFKQVCHNGECIIIEESKIKNQE